MNRLITSQLKYLCYRWKDEDFYQIVISYVNAEYEMRSWREIGAPVKTQVEADAIVNWYNSLTDVVYYKLFLASERRIQVRGGKMITKLDMLKDYITIIAAILAITVFIPIFIQGIVMLILCYFLHFQDSYIVKKLAKEVKI